MITTNARFAHMTPAQLRRSILITRRRFRKAQSKELRLRLIRNHTDAMTELRSRNLT